MSSSEGESNKPRCSLHKNKLKPNNEIVNTSVRHKVSAKYVLVVFQFRQQQELIKCIVSAFVS